MQNSRIFGAGLFGRQLRAGCHLFDRGPGVGAADHGGNGLEMGLGPGGCAELLGGSGGGAACPGSLQDLGLAPLWAPLSLGCWLSV